MTSLRDYRIVFRAPAGARRGYGHLVRCLSLARALGVRPLIALRGDAHACDVALALGAELLVRSLRRIPRRRTQTGRKRNRRVAPSPPRTAAHRPLAPSHLRAVRPDLVVVDDPETNHARRWIDAARRAGALVVTIHDLGIGCADGDLVIDGSIARHARAPRGRTLAGSRFAVLDPDLPRVKRTGKEGRRVLIALGGGPHAAAARQIAEAIVATDREAQVHIAAGFVSTPPAGSSRAFKVARESVRWVAAKRGLAAELACADVAIVGGGVSLYEACAMGVPSVALPVVRAQVPTVQAFARHGAAIALPPRAGAHVAASAAVRLLDDRRRRASMAKTSKRLVDGRGALRAAGAVSALLERRAS